MNSSTYFSVLAIKCIRFYTSTVTRNRGDIRHISSAFQEGI